MEAKKVAETGRLSQQAHRLLCAHLRAAPRAPLSKKEQRCLRETLHLLQLSLSIVRSFEQQQPVYQAVYATVSSAIAQVLPCLDGAAPSATTTPRIGADGQNSEWRKVPGTAGDTEKARSEETSDKNDPPRTDAHTAPPAPRWSDMYGCAEAIVALQQATILPLQYPHLFTGPRHPWRRLLLYGPPGTGKTQLAAATAAEFGAVFLSVSAADLLSKWVGESEKQVRHAFARAAAATPRCVLFFDEVDALCNARGGHGESEVARRLKTEFLLHLQNVAPTVVVLAATNLPWELDAAIVRRFDRFIHVGLPSSGERLRFLQAELQAVPHAVTEGGLREVVIAQTESFSLVDMRRLLSHAVMLPVTEWLQSRKCGAADAVEHTCPSGVPSLEANEESVVAAAVLSPPSPSSVSPSPCPHHQAEEVLGDNVHSSDCELEDDGVAVGSTASHCASSTASTSSESAQNLTQVPTPCITVRRQPSQTLVPPVELRHFEQALRSVVATTPAAELIRYASWSSAQKAAVP